MRQSKPTPDFSQGLVYTDVQITNQGDRTGVRRLFAMIHHVDVIVPHDTSKAKLVADQHEFVRVRVGIGVEVVDVVDREVLHV